MPATVVLGLLIALAVTFVSMALLVRTSFGRAPHVITAVPVSLVLYSLWVSAWFAFEVLRQFVVTAISPATALRLVAFVFLWAAFFSVGFLYACLAAVHQLLGGAAARRTRRAAKYLALGYGAALVVGWSAYHFNAEAGLLTMLRRGLGHAHFPLALGAWIWLLARGRALSDPRWRERVVALARTYVVLFSMMALASVVRDRLGAVSPAVPLAADVFLLLAYALVTVVWVESVEKAARPAAVHQAMP